MVWNFVFAGIALICAIYCGLVWRSSQRRYKELLANEARRQRMNEERRQRLKKELWER